MLKRLLACLRERMAGARLARSIKRNERAANQLDMVLREVLKR